MSPKKKRLVDDIYHPPHSERLVCLGTIFVSEISIHAFHLTKILPRIFVETSGPQFWCKNLSHPPLSAATSGGREVGSTPKVTDFGKTNYCHIKGQSDYEPLISSFWIFRSNSFYTSQGSSTAAHGFPPPRAARSAGGRRSHLIQT